MHEKYYKYWDRNAIVAAFVKDDPIMANVRSLTGLPMSSFELAIDK